MNPTQCKATLIDGDSKYYCGRHYGHAGEHKTLYSYIPNVSWPNGYDTAVYAAHPAGKASGKTANWAHIVDAELDRIKNETHVLLTKEDLITISYYLPFYTDDDDDPDNITKAKIDTALKKML